jgi:hypothetical protein
MKINICAILHSFIVTVFQILILIFSFVSSCCGLFTAKQYGSHAALAYSARYLRRQSTDNSERTWHGLLIRNMPICISSTTFGMEMLQLHQGNTRVDVHIEGNPTEMCLQRYTGV